MTDHVLVPFDGSPLAERALAHSLETHPEASITVLYVIDPIDSMVAVEAGGLPAADGWYETARERAETVLAGASERAAARNIDVDTVTEVGRPARTIVTYADEHDVDQIIMGGHGRRGIERAILGSVAETVMRRARMPVTVVK